MDKKIDKLAKDLRLWYLGLSEWQKWLSAPFVLASIIIAILMLTVLVVPFATVVFPFILSRLILSNMFGEGWGE